MRIAVLFLALAAACSSAPPPPPPPVETSFDFALVRADAPTEQTVLIGNPLSGEASVELVEPAGNGFEPAPGTFPAVAPQGGLLQLPVVFTPTGPGLHEGTLTLRFRAGDDSRRVILDLSATVEDPIVALVASTIDFGNVRIGATATRTIDVRNGSARTTLEITQLSPLPAGFTVVGGAPPFFLQPGATASIAVRYEPQTPGPRNEAVALSRSDDPVPLVASLTAETDTWIEHPATFWRDNTLMSVSVLEGCRLAGVPRLVSVGTVCAYPKHTPVPFREESLWDGFPEETNAPYGVAKRNLLMGALAYRREFGLGGAHLLPANLYGPGDDFDPQTSHVIPALIRKCEEARAAGRATVPVWGTGAASREFLFVADCAAAVVQAVSVDHAQPINLGTGREIVIRDLVGLVARATGFGGSFEWDTSRPDGQPRRVLDTSRARDSLGWTAATTLEEGLEQTVAWFRSHA